MASRKPTKRKTVTLRTEDYDLFLNGLATIEADKAGTETTEVFAGKDIVRKYTSIDADALFNGGEIPPAVNVHLTPEQFDVLSIAIGRGKLVDGGHWFGYLDMLVGRLAFFRTFDEIESAHRDEANEIIGCYEAWLEHNPDQIYRWSTFCRENGIPERVARAIPRFVKLPGSEMYW